MGAPKEMDTLWNESYQRAKKIVSDSAGLVGFAIKLSQFCSNLPERQVKFSGKLK